MNIRHFNQFVIKALAGNGPGSRVGFALLAYCLVVVVTVVAAVAVVSGEMSVGRLPVTF